MTCPGPFLWFECFAAEDGAVLWCVTCGHITVTGNWNQPDHAQTPVLMQGLAS